MANGVCDSFCDRCVYSIRSNGGGGYLLCNYYLTTNISRPCPAGKGCTVKKTGKKVSKWSYENHNAWEAAKRQAKEKRKTEYQEKLRQLRKEIKMTTKVCAECGEEFQTDNPKRIYCSDRCKNRVESRKRYERVKAGREKARQEAKEKGFIL